MTTTSDGDGQWIISGMQPGPVKVVISSPGFKAAQHDLELHGSRAARMGTTLQVGTVSETVTVTADGADATFGRINEAKKSQLALLNAPSQNIEKLQRRVAGVLPVQMDVPRGGKSYRFVRPLVLDEETRITFQYKSR